MSAVIDRDYCLKHPVKIIRLFGLGVYLGMALSTHKTLLQRVTEKYQASRIPFPGPVGNAYRLSALFELRVSRIYAAMARQFAHEPDAAKLFSDLSQEETEHGRVMLTCLFQVTLSPKVGFIPSIRDPEIRAGLARLRALERRVRTLTLDEALDLALDLERGEVNIIFGRLLAQVDSAQLALFAERLRGPQNHSQSVPKRVKALRQGRATNTAAAAA